MRSYFDSPENTAAYLVEPGPSGVAFDSPQAIPFTIIDSLGFGHGHGAPWATGIGFGHGPFGHVRQHFDKPIRVPSYFIDEQLEAGAAALGFGLGAFGDEEFGQA